MCADIMLLSNTLVYDHRLRCASPALASARLALTSDFAGSQDSAWLRAAVDPLRRVVFLDTDSLGGGGQEARQQGAVHNMAEACLVAKASARAHRPCTLAALSAARRRTFKKLYRSIPRAAMFYSASRVYGAVLSDREASMRFFS